MSTEAIEEWSRPPTRWVEDFVWHRRMYRQSRFRWLPVDAMSLALRYGGGRSEWTTRRDFSVLAGHYRMLLDAVAAIEDAQGRRFPVLDSQLPSGAEPLLAGLHGVPTDRVIGVETPADVAAAIHRVLDDLPFPNPLTEIWELEQLRGMYRAGAALLQQGLADLGRELLERGTTPQLLASLAGLEDSALQQLLLEPAAVPATQTFPHLPAHQP